MRKSLPCSAFFLATILLTTLASAQQADRFVNPGLAKLGDDDAQTRKAACHLIQQMWPGKFQFALFGKLADGMNQDRHAEHLGLAV